MSDFKYKMVDGELVELTPEEIAEFELMLADWLKREEAAQQPQPTQQ